MSFTRAMRWGLTGLGALGLVTMLAVPAQAQDGPEVAVTGGIDFTNQYNFRGIRQNGEGIAVWPFIDLGISSGNVTVNLGTWNALLSQFDGNKWYEADLYASVGVTAGSTALGVTYTSYTSPGDYFAHVKELAVKAAFDDSAALGRGSLKPYALVAFELGDASADGGTDKGTYLELGVAPGVAGDRASLAIPIKVGLSLKDYYEFGTGEDSKFGYFSIGGVVTVPFNDNFNLHGGVEFQTFGENVKNYNGFGDDGDGPAAIASIGIGFSF